MNIAGKGEFRRAFSLTSRKGNRPKLENFSQALVVRYHFPHHQRDLIGLVAEKVLGNKPRPLSLSRERHLVGSEERIDAS